VAEVIAPFGRLVVGGKGELFVELTDPAAVESLKKALEERFENQVLLAP
jgi:hypothetical protein